ncbi:MAG: GMC family oxidoreductase [Nocardioides sp.]|nr:GMC family oxidoreductase [Nocardioides sp.]
MVEHFDVVIVGSGAGGGTMARSLAGTNARVLLVERGDWMPQEEQNWDPVAVWRENRYRAGERWLDRRGKEFVPFMHYLVGGNTKMWGAVLYRLREEDFQEVEHADGISPAWPITYDDLAPWYDQAEEMYHVHGEAGVDPTDPVRRPFPHAAVPHEAEIEELAERLRAQGLHPAPLPLALIDPGASGGCQLCNTCNSFPCRVRRKAEADTCGVSPALDAGDVTLWTRSRVRRVLTDHSGEWATGVVVERDGEQVEVRAEVVVLSAGAVNSAALLLASADERHPDGLANSSGLVGRRYMAHRATMMESVDLRRPHDTVFQKTLAINDFYHATDKHPFPLGNIQSQGRVHPAQVSSVVPLLPTKLLEGWTRRGVEWLAMSEDLPEEDNRVTLTPSGQVRLSYRRSASPAHRLLVKEARAMMRRAGYPVVITHEFKNENTTHQCGTVVFGDDPRTSVLDPMCRAHELANLYVVDASFFPSSAAVNPGLTVVAQSLRVADHIASTHGWQRRTPVAEALASISVPASTPPGGPTS